MTTGELCRGPAWRVCHTCHTLSYVSAARMTARMPIVIRFVTRVTPVTPVTGGFGGSNGCSANQMVVVDHAGNVVSADRMDGAALQNIRFAEGKAFASALYRQTTEELGALYKSRPDRYFGIMNMYPGKIYLVGGGVPLAVDGQLVGGVGVAGLPEGVDEKSARAGIAAWMKLRGTMNK